MKKIITALMLGCMAVAAYGQEPDSVAVQDTLGRARQGREQKEQRERRRDDRQRGVPQMTFDSDEHDFGEISESGRKVSHDFVFTNTGDCPLVVTLTITSCKCTDIAYSKKPVPPGGEGILTVTYNPKKQQGVFHKTIQVYSNIPDKVSFIRIKGEVVP